MTCEQIIEGARSQGRKERMQPGALVAASALPNWKRISIVKGRVKDFTAEEDSDELLSVPSQFELGSQTCFVSSGGDHCTVCPAQYQSTYFKGCEGANFSVKSQRSL